MKSKCKLSKFSAQRAVLSDMLPFEIPPSFSNGGYFHFLSKYNVRIKREKNHNGKDIDFIEWDCPDTSCDEVIKLIFNAADPFIVCVSDYKEFGAHIPSRKARLSIGAMRTHPFHFEIAHKDNDSRCLSIIHPRNQLDVANFYSENSSLITYYSSLSPFSLRKPASVAKDVFYDDKLHKKRLGEQASLREEHHKEYQYLASYFTYEKYSNIFRFYESYGYQKAERSFVRLLKLDISKCFDSIYTHSLPWALLGKMPTKDNLPLSKSTFGGRFDALMQNMNNGETNGILIGPEFSRIFAELILQSVDCELQRRLLRDHEIRNKVDYEIFRYVDDFFIFHNDCEHAQLIEQHLSAILRNFKLNLNAHKASVIEKPIITHLTIAKNRIHTLLAEQIGQDYIKKTLRGSGEEIEIFSPNLNANKLIVGFKTVLKETNTTYQESLNYTFSAIEKAFNRLNAKFVKNRNDLKKKNCVESPDEKVLIDSLIGLLEFSFFIYSAAQRVNFTVRLVRSICFVVDALNEMAIADDLKNQFFKFAHDNIVRILKSNPIRRYREVETLYLILALKKLGRNYRIDIETLASYFRFSKNASGAYKAEAPLSMFSITTILLLIRNIQRYTPLKTALEECLIEKIQFKSAYAKNDAEMVMFYLDIITCPYISNATKSTIDAVFKLSPTQRQEIYAVNSHWFTDWGKFDLTLALDKKRARQVY